MTEIQKPAQKAQAEEPKKAEGALDDKQLDSVTGGDKASPTLTTICTTGKHFPTVKLTT